MATVKSACARLRKAALADPSVREEVPWGDRVVTVRGKIFVFLGVSAGALHFTCKLPLTSEMALSLPFTQPTGYGLGKAGVTINGQSAGILPDLELQLSDYYRLRGWTPEGVPAPERLASLGLT